MIGICMGIDLHKRLEEQLRQRLEELAVAEDRIRSVGDHVVNGIMVIGEPADPQAGPAVAGVFRTGEPEMLADNPRRIAGAVGWRRGASEAGAAVGFASATVRTEL